MILSAIWFQPLSQPVLNCSLHISPLSCPGADEEQRDIAQLAAESRSVSHHLGPRYLSSRQPQADSTIDSVAEDLESEPQVSKVLTKMLQSCCDAQVGQVYVGGFFKCLAAQLRVVQRPLAALSYLTCSGLSAGMLHDMDST